MNANRFSAPVRTSSRQALDAIQYLLLTGHVPDDLPAELKADATLGEVLAQLEQLQQFALALANGDLAPELKLKGRVAGALKSLQANLRHLTWQTQQIAAGDLTQRVRFMGVFAVAFNTMVEHLDRSREALELHALELAQEHQKAVSLMREAQAARLETQVALEQLQEQLDEIRALQAQLREQAIRDSLTGCFNRRYLDEALPREFARAEREAYPLCIMMVDIDDFKRLNDEFGHLAGDLMLQGLGRLLSSRTRAGDIVCRYGGDEFLGIFPTLAFGDARRRAEALCDEFAELKVVFDGKVLQSEVSIGVACFPLHGATMDQVLRAADQALYHAKESGRRRVQLDGE